MFLLLLQILCLFFVISSFSWNMFSSICLCHRDMSFFATSSHDIVLQVLVCTQSRYNVNVFFLNFPFSCPLHPLPLFVDDNRKVILQYLVKQWILFVLVFIQKKTIWTLCHSSSTVFCRTKTLANKIPYFTKHCRITYYYLTV